MLLEMHRSGVFNLEYVFFRVIWVGGVSEASLPIYACFWRNGLNEIRKISG